LSELFREDFLQSFKEAETPFQCTNLSDIFHLTALWFCSCVMQQKAYLRTKGKNSQYYLPSNCSFAIGLPPTAVFPFRYNWFFTTLH